MSTSMSQSAALRTSDEVISTFSTVSCGASVRSASACSSVSVVAMTLCPRSARASAAPFPNPEPAPVINTVFVMMGLPSFAPAAELRDSLEVPLQHREGAVGAAGELELGERVDRLLVVHECYQRGMAR